MPNFYKKGSYPGRKIGGAIRWNPIERPTDPFGGAIFDGILEKSNKVIRSGASGKPLKMLQDGDLKLITEGAKLRGITAEQLKLIVKRSFSVEDVLDEIQKIPIKLQ